VEHDERMDNITLGVQTLVEKVNSHDHAIETNRDGLILNAEAINDMRIDMETEQEVMEERLDRTVAAQKIYFGHNEKLASACEQMKTLFEGLATQTKEVNVEIENNQYDAEKVYTKLPPPNQVSFRKKHRRKRGKKRSRFSSAVPVPVVYKKTKWTDNEKLTPVLAEATAATTRTHAIAEAKERAKTAVAQAKAALESHTQQEESRREKEREQHDSVGAPPPARGVVSPGL
jgi:hypothetical protein